ncbi:putative C2H2 finger domain protein [Aspergillus saccharolyticus JOP 1030-1]|uniref:C2H2-type domain-containing protein n=1 Tax=Aspergillus saccharolyticus JOP 1030-1 TaxID=1450539 RepID=A0A318ZBA0_9EURO|nr:hypothetical protein BP01DRAFT_374635 [Aspergillus saccharolyticus JOP 1030-1]PYH44646.1 hypothetical protein BP01DRAFT_374635 [Aspergillus saccharolyticus JOP 1030-1]
MAPASARGPLSLRRGFTNPTPKTESARSALNSFTCTLCNKSYSRHPEYEAHISSYDHQHRKRLQDLKQLSRDPNAAEKARRAERKADAEAGLRVLDTHKSKFPTIGTGTGNNLGSGAGGGFKKGGFKSSFTAVKGPVAPVAPTKKNVLGGDDDDHDDSNISECAVSSNRFRNRSAIGPDFQQKQEESDTECEVADVEYYSPRHPTGCHNACTGYRTENGAEIAIA